MRLAASIGLAAFTMFAASPALGVGDAIVCVQKELNDLGYNAGTPDGALGKRTLAASEKYREDMAASSPGWSLEALGQQSAAHWCDTVADAHSQVKKHYAEFLGTEPPAFDPDFDIIQQRFDRLFDAEYYLAQVPRPAAAKSSPFLHYLGTGWKLGYEPSPLFDGKAYLAANPDVVALGMNPLAHYVSKGMADYRGFGAVADESGFIFDVGPNVPDREVVLIKKGLAMAQSFLGQHLGGGIPPDVTAHITVKIEATGKGNQEHGANGGNATALSEINDLLPRPYFDVAHKDWDQHSERWGWSEDADQLSMVIHEFTHGWQALLGGQSNYQQPLGNWINEGVATYVANSAVVEAGMVSRKDFDRFMLRASLDTREASFPLEDLGSSVTPVWAGHIGYLAISWLVAESPNGIMSLRILATELKRTNSVNQAFRAAFDIELADFYEQFEKWRPMIRRKLGTALAKRPKLINIGDT